MASKNQVLKKKSVEPAEKKADMVSKDAYSGKITREYENEAKWLVTCKGKESTIYSNKTKKQLLETYSFVQLISPAKTQPKK